MKFIIDDIILLFLVFISILFIFSKKDHKILLKLLFLQIFLNIAYFISNIHKESDFIIVSSFSLFLPLLVIFIFCFYEKMNLIGTNHTEKSAKIAEYFIIFISTLLLFWTTICILKNYKIMNINLPFFYKNPTNEEVITTQTTNKILQINRNYILVTYIIIIFTINTFKNIWIKNEK